ncbi:polysaccharide pyruvyl transferase family protein [Salinimicrobium sediminilitoris]|uniref:polysaccharide pyruvyl transferase family protein n=1 Tax=Salinimicrobium sediminilitoris TaxID=2876715 RepID=UPI001E4BE8DF|nr:polysaccharide pyruvyl transferase family protein [Salinimicrobium sediminilitoris]MCC8358457.1 polysaccharide pyruvyl transferase family protein [Salinimicrobium sediminilitoris]
MEKKVKAWWHANEGKFNFGDELNPYLIQKISGKEVIRVETIPLFSFQKVNICIGSVIIKATRSCNVWGAGIIEKNSHIHKSNFFAVRGPFTQRRMTDLGLKAPKVVGDPALLLSMFYKPKLKKKYKIGVIPHIIDLPAIASKKFSEDITVIDFTYPSVESIIDRIGECEYIISSSLHGIIVAHSYGIPAVWAEFSNKLFGDGIKFLDYFASVGLPTELTPIKLDPKKLEEKGLKKILPVSTLADPAVIKARQKELLYVCPFK